MKIRVLHSYYGCESGCCGHVVEIDGEQVGMFDFHHSAETEEGLRELVLESVPKECHDSIDWSTLEPLPDRASC